MFEIFEGRYDAYPLARKWIDEWFLKREFTVKDSEKQRIANLISNLNFDAFRVKDSLQEKMGAQLLLLLEKISERQSNVGFAVSFFFFTWNLQRFRHYFSRKTNFSLIDYFENVGNEFGRLKKQFEFFRSKNLLSDDIYEEKVIETYGKVNEILKATGIGNNEPIGTVKLLHVFSPSYFPLLDNPIAEQLGLKEKGVSVDAELYIRWMQRLKSWLGNYKDVIEELENKHESSILKLIDEALYIMCSVNLHIRVGKLGI
ncbi:hypothetical protein [Archaeoglobus sulfaticallidus]|uniref:hypothetical protein n=1 Tax=Archaeoglobus sulfaticallidus TaxID=1316941 RepID=UPI001181A983|nr:hypothetical protein [Archaeoglobus sulfaticallidus]